MIDRFGLDWVATLQSLGGPGSGNFGHAGRPGEVGGSAPDGDGPIPTHGRRYNSEDGYRWHEEGVVAEWGRSLSKEDRLALTGYSGFGYVGINNTLRGELPTKLVTVRKATDEEITQYRDRLRKGEEIEVADGTLVLSGLSFVVQDRPVDDEQVVRIMKSADQLNECIRERGIELDEDIEVSRYAYFPRVLSSSLADHVGTTRIEDGFTSTMLGDANGRLAAGPAAAKAESIYNRTSKLDAMNTEVGSAVLFSIIIPKGTKVASVEAARRTDYSYENTGGKDDLTQKNSRVESEILLGSGARFRVQAVEPGPVSKYGGYSVPTTRITMTYIGGGSSDGRRS